ncbi:Hypothetical predicted protein [Mytilus galloprovincialis]|uniref:Uncharacterized protein n=1 Tax=Mytilus galloprovincialis TaxID=29158 RepID=A0A8B6H2I7_MYTGA|nr:Hypothetical predicted protein [Mytilus galloprovincialis]
MAEHYSRIVYAILFGNRQQETEVRMMTIQALKLVKLCKNQYESDDIFISDDNKKCPREFMDSMKYVAKYIMNKRSYNSYDQINYHEKDDKGTDPFKKKIHPTKKKKGKGIAERLNKKRYKVSLSAKPFNIEETTQKKNNEYDGNIVTRQEKPLSTDLFFSPSMRTKQNADDFLQEKPLSADIFFAPSVRTKQNADDILRQEQDIKIQAMTEEAERLETICKNQHFKQRHTIQDHSHCPPSFLQTMLHIEDYLYDLRINLDVIKREKIYSADRLSSVDGSMLTENKPNITDLNDPNRATKLAEKWCKIFDDEWTDALDSLEKKYSKKNHEQYVHHLFSLIEEAQRFI